MTTDRGRGVTASDDSLPGLIRIVSRLGAKSGLRITPVLLGPVPPPDCDVADAMSHPTRETRCDAGRRRLSRRPTRGRPGTSPPPAFRDFPLYDYCPSGGPVRRARFGVRHETTSGPRPRTAAPASRRIIPLSYRLQALARSLARRRHCRHSHVKVFDTSGCRKSSRRYTRQYVRPAVYSAADAAIPRTDRGSGPRLSPRPPTGVGGRPASSTPLTTVPAPGARRTNPGSLVLYRSGS